MSSGSDWKSAPTESRMLGASIDAAALRREIVRAATQKIERKALRIEEAAECLGVSVDFFREHIAPDLKLIRKGRVRLIPVAELDRWVDESACSVFNG